LCKLIAGSEGTLMFITEITLNLLPLPPQEISMVCIHTRTIDEALRANSVAMRHRPMASELVDKYILDFTKGHPEYDKNRFFIHGDPKAILIVEFMADTPETVTARTQALINDLKLAGLGYEFPVVSGAQTKQVWDVRKAGLGLIRNLPGDDQPVNLIEDCAVTVEDLPDYIAELETLLKSKGLSYSMYAHAGAGELHVEPMINLKTEEGKVLFREVLTETAALVKKYGGSLSGEHGDGRLRGEFIPLMVGEKVYQLFKDVKRAFDPDNIFNPGKITATPPMDTHLRYTPGQATPDFKTVFSFEKQRGILRHAEQCSGSGDCRKTHLSGGTMCPSYMATRDEKHTTRARANILREWLTKSPPTPEGGDFPLPSGEGRGGAVGMAAVKDVMDLCLSCKGCKAECPSNVDVAKLKAEFMQRWHDEHGVPLRTRLIANFGTLSAIAARVPWAYNAVFGTPALRRLASRAVGFHPDRTLPLLARTTLREWHMARIRNSIPAKGQTPALPAAGGVGRTVYLFCDEFTNHNDVGAGQKAILLLERLGYRVTIPGHTESGRAALSKGLLRKAKKIAERNVALLSGTVSEQTPLVGIEPSAILAFRDEYPELVGENLRADAHRLAGNALMLEEFIAREADRGNIRREQFTAGRRLVKLHGHCQQKAVASMAATKRMLSLPQNYRVELIPSGCCGMAGSFGYEREHYGVSMRIGELVLFPAVRTLEAETLIAAPGTSCRHQILDGTGRHALHPAEILYDALV